MNLEELKKMNIHSQNYSFKQYDTYSEVVFQRDHGRGRLRFIRISPSMILAYIKVYAPIWEHKDTATYLTNPLLINYCVKGRCELQLDNHEYTFVSNNEVSVSLAQAKDDYHYPGSCYEGMELFIYPDSFSHQDETLFDQSVLSLQQLILKYCHTKDTFTFYASDILSQLFLQLWKKQSCEEPAMIRLKVMEILLTLQSETLTTPAIPRTYYTLAQIEIAKQVEAVLLQDMSQHYTMHQLAHMFHVSESSLNKYFKGVFGKNISTYMKVKRMELAASMLVKKDWRLAEIAGAVGYENHSKFSAAFKSVYQKTPLAYRQLYMRSPE